MIRLLLRKSEEIRQSKRIDATVEIKLNQPIQDITVERKRGEMQEKRNQESKSVMFKYQLVNETREKIGRDANQKI